MCVDFDPPELYRETHHTARRKAHRCEECSRTISIGEGYWSVFGVFEGDPFRCTTCDQCRAACEWLLVVCSGFLHNDVENELTEHLQEPYPISTYSLARLVVMMRRKWLRRDGSMWTVDQVTEIRKRAVRPWREWDTDQRWAAQIEREMRTA